MYICILLLFISHLVLSNPTNEVVYDWDIFILKLLSLVYLLHTLAVKNTFVITRHLNTGLGTMVTDDSAEATLFEKCLDDELASGRMWYQRLRMWSSLGRMCLYIYHVYTYMYMKRSRPIVRYRALLNRYDENYLANYSSAVLTSFVFGSY